MGAARTLAELLADAAATDPNRAAVEVDGVDLLTYRAWDERSGAVAAGLRHRGVVPGDRVVLVFDTARWCDYAVAYLGVHRAGAVALPLTAGAGPLGVVRVVREHRPAVVLAPADLTDGFPHVSPLRLGDLESDGRRHPLLRADDPRAWPPLGDVLTVAPALAPPAAVPRTPGELLAVPPWLDAAAAPARLVHTYAPGTAIGQDALRAALSAPVTTMRVVPAVDPDRLGKALARDRVRTCVLHPAIARVLVDSGAFDRYDLRGVERVVLASGRPSPALLEALQRVLPQATIVRADAGGTAAHPAPVGGEVAPVAFSQEGMIWHEHFVPGCQNLPGLARRYRGPLDVEALDRALDEILRRHEPLRTTFRLDRGHLLQAVRPHQRGSLPVHDLRGLAAGDREDEVARQVTDAGRRPFDLTHDPVFTAWLLRVADDDHVLVIRTHHSVFDDWSVGVFRRELAALYTAFSAGEPSKLADPLRFTDFARNQRRRLAGTPGTKQLAFWRRELGGGPFTAQLPVDDPAAAPGSTQTAGQPVMLTLPPALHEGLRARAREQRATVFMTMLAAYATLVHRYTGQDDLLLATVVANRNRTELEGLVGCFTKKVPLRLRLDGDPAFTEVLKRTRAALLGALTNQDLPFEAVVQDVLGAPAAAHGLVPHVVLMFQGEAPRHELVLPGLETTGFDTATTARRAHFMAEEAKPAAGAGGHAWGGELYLGTFVILSVAESDDALTCIARGAFHGPAVRSLLDTYRTLLGDIVTDPDRPLSQLELLDEPGSADALAQGRGPQVQVPSATLHAALRTRAEQDPGAVAVRHGRGQVTRGQLWSRVVRLAERLRAAGVEPGATVGLALEPSPEAVVGAFGIWQAGAAWVGLDPDDDGDRLAAVLAQTTARLVVGADPRGALPPHARLVAVADDGTAAASVAPLPEVRPDAPAIVFHGAGPTAVPDGVVLDHRCLLAMAARLRGLRDRPPGPARHVCLSAAVTDDGFLRQLTAVLDGHTLWVPDRSLPTDPAATVDLVCAGQVDTLDCTPGELTALLDSGLQEAVARRPPGAVQPLLTVGSRWRVDPAAWAAMRGLAGVRTIALYGVPACGFAATATAAADSARPVVGRPLPGVHAHVLDRLGRPLPPRAAGELHLGGSPARLLATGQRARRLPDGTLELLGPLHTDSDLRGFIVDTERIQSALAGLPGLREVTVVVDRDASGGPRLVAHIAADGPPPTLSALRAHLWATLPGYACPSVIVPAGQDVTSRETAVDGAVAASAASAARAGGGGSAESTVLRELWAEVLDADHVAADSNYWQHFSFLEVLRRAQEVGLAVAGEHVTRNRTIETLAADLARRPAAGQ